MEEKGAETKMRRKRKGKTKGKGRRKQERSQKERENVKEEGGENEREWRQNRWNDRGDKIAKKRT